MEPIRIKEEPEDFENVSIKIEPLDDYKTDSNYEYFNGTDVFKYEREIKEEAEEISDNEPDESMSPLSYHPSPRSPESTCRVVILEQPLKKLRFRYLSELQGTPHGPLLGEQSTKNRKTFPTVKLVGYEGKEQVKMRCWLVDKADHSHGAPVRPHCHDLVVRKCSPKNEIVCEPHEVVISRENQYTAVFENMVVLHNVQKDSETKYLNKEHKWLKRDGSAVQLPKLDKKKIRDRIKSINKNEVYLYFEAYIEYRNSVHILSYALSNSIKNLKNPVSGDLKICRVLNSVGPSTGNTEVAVFTERVPPDVKIKVFSVERSWVKIVSPEFMHRNIALTFRMPHCPHDIDDDFTVQFCLYRDSDEAESNSFPFVYQQTSYTSYGAKKRRFDDSSSSHLSTSPNSMTDMGDSNDISTEFFNGNVLIGEEIPDGELLFRYIEDESLNSSTEVDQMLNSDREFNKLLEVENDENLQNFSGTSLQNMLCSNDPMISGNGFVSSSNIISQNDMSYDIVCDGVDSPTYSNIMELNQDMNSAYNVQRRRLGKIVKDLLLTRKYNHHVNCLQQAVMEDRIDVVKRILIDIKLFMALPCDSKISKSLATLPFNIIQIRNEFHQTVLHTAVLLKRDRIIQMLLDFGYNPLDKDKNGNNAFHMAVIKSSCSTLKALVTGSIDTRLKPLQQRKDKKLLPSVLSTCNFEGHNILHLAVRSSSLDIVKYIVSLKLVDINSPEVNSGDSPLHIACRLQKLEIAEYLIHNGADISLVNLQGYSPLHLSVSRNDHEMAKLLIKEKGNPRQECLSLTRALELKEVEDEFSEESGTDKDSAIEGDVYSSFDAFSLANDLMMFDILSGKEDLSKVNEDLTEISSPPSKKGGTLMTSDQVEKLSIVLRENNCWRDVSKSLNLDKKYPHLESLIEGFKEPEKMLLNRINRQKDEILEDDDQLGEIVGIFKTLKLDEAVHILTSKERQICL